MGGRGQKAGSRRIYGRANAVKKSFSSSAPSSPEFEATDFTGIITPKPDPLSFSVSFDTSAINENAGLLSSTAPVEINLPPGLTSSPSSQTDPDSNDGSSPGTSITPNNTSSGPDSPSFQVINFETPLGGAVYPFAEITGRAWNLVSSPSKVAAQYPNPASFGMEKPTLRWINGDQRKDLFIDGMNLQEFQDTTGLRFDMKKEGFVLSKRISRLMRPYFASGYYPAEAVSITYMNQDSVSGKVWDGAGLISRDMLFRMVIPPHVSDAKREALMRELSQCKRVEFTIMTEKGQDKGHAIVADHLPSDFVLPRDTKGEVRLVNGQTFVGINFVHHHDEMRMDIQSLVNLHPFYSEDQLTTWMEQEGELFAEAVRSGDVAEAMSRLDHHTTMDEVGQWALREYFASGGQPMWFSDVAKNLMNQHLKRLNSSTLEDLRLPIPGGRFYVMPIGVGRAAGVDHEVPRGHVRIDREYGTAWVNDEDWVEIQDAVPDPKSGKVIGIAGILGGADNDDALWVHGFTDHDGAVKILCWRSPNQTGEYVILKPTIGSYNLDWQTTGDVVQYPPADSRMLPPRKDQTRLNYLNLVPGVRPPDNPPQYSIEAMDKAIRQSIDNAGVLGMYCNYLMVRQAADGKLPKTLPAELEDIIDSSVKTGADLSRVREWLLVEFKKILDSGKPIPAVLSQRIPGAKNRPVMPTENHWLDRLTERIRTHIGNFEQTRDQIAQDALPPATVFDHVFNDTDQAMLEAGASLNHLYNNTTRLLRKKHGELGPEQYEEARIKAENYLDQFPPEQQGAVIRGAIVSAYISEKHIDRVLWLNGAKTEQGHAPGMAQKTMAALREIGVLNELGQTRIGVIAYPGAQISKAQYERTIGISGVWFNEARRAQQANGQIPSAEMHDVPKPLQTWAKTRVAEAAQTDFRDLPLVVKTDGDRKIAYTEDGQIFGFIAKDSTKNVPEGKIRIVFSLSKDGNLRCVWNVRESEQDTAEVEGL